MRYWWVNQNQTYRAEVSGGYLWSPKRNRNGARNQFYENMRLVAPGDLVLSFRDARIGAVGITSSFCYDATKPAEFGPSGANWENAGWRVDVHFKELPKPVRPKDHIDNIRPLLPDKYSPLQDNGDGLQSIYLAELSESLASFLMEMLSYAGNDLPSGPISPDPGRRDEVVTQADEEALTGVLSGEMPETEKQQLVLARRGQGRFRGNVGRYETCCRVTGLSDVNFLIASHIKPWRWATNEERLDGENGLLLSPNVDFLFDRGFVSFTDEGRLLVSPAVEVGTLRLLGVPVEGRAKGAAFTAGQRCYLAIHRTNIFLGSREAP